MRQERTPKGVRTRLRLDSYLLGLSPAVTMDVCLSLPLGKNRQLNADTSTLRMCARYQNPLGIGIDSAIICRESKAKSFVLP